MSMYRYRAQSALNLERYRVLGGTRCEVVEGVAMVVRSGFIIAGLLQLDGLLIVE